MSIISHDNPNRGLASRLEAPEYKNTPSADPPNTTISNSCATSSNDLNHTPTLPNATDIRLGTKDPRRPTVDITQTIQSHQDTLETMRKYIQLHQTIASEYLNTCFKQHKEIEQLRALVKMKDEIIRGLLERGCDGSGLMSEQSIDEGNK
jgi:hypothetical protein